MAYELSNTIYDLTESNMAREQPKLLLLLWNEY